MAGGPGKSGQIATLFRSERERAGLTQRQLDDESGISRNTIMETEAGRTLPGLDTLFRLGWALDIPELVCVTALTRDTLRSEPDKLKRFEEQLAESSPYAKALAKLGGLSVDTAYSTMRLAADGSVRIDQRFVGCVPTRTLRSLSFTTPVLGEPSRVSASFSIVNAPADMQWEEAKSLEDNELVNRILLAKPLPTGSATLELENTFSVPAGYLLLPAEHKKRINRLFPVERWPGRFLLYVGHVTRRAVVRVEHAEKWRGTWGPARCQWGQRPLDMLDEYAIEKGLGCADFSVENGEHFFVLTVERPAAGFAFGLQWVADDDREAA